MVTFLWNQLQTRWFMLATTPTQPLSTRSVTREKVLSVMQTHSTFIVHRALWNSCKWLPVCLRAIRMQLFVHLGGGYGVHKFYYQFHLDKGTCSRLLPERSHVPRLHAHVEPIIGRQHWARGMLVSSCGWLVVPSMVKRLHNRSSLAYFVLSDLWLQRDVSLAALVGEDTMNFGEVVSNFSWTAKATV